MKKLLIRNTLLIILSSFSLTITVFSQDRTVTLKANISTETVSELKKAKGWMLNEDKEWVSLENTIPTSNLGSRYKSLLDYEEYGLGSDNFNYFKLKEISYKDSTYYVLIKQYRDGWYKYKNIRKGWRQYKSHLAYVFDKNELSKLKNINDSQINKIEIQLIDTHQVNYTAEDKAIELIQTKIKLDKPLDKNFKLILHIAPYKEKNIVQFQIYIAYNKRIAGINSSNSGKVKQYYLKDDLFKHFYYETDYSTFNKFLNIQDNKTN